jgi:tetratricopeptide (TPR) repeat protein
LRPPARDEALRSFSTAVALQPQSAAAHFNLGHVLAQQGRLAEAAAALQRATQLQPDYAQAHAYLGAVLVQHEKLDESYAALQQALALQPDLGQAYDTLGFVLRKMGQPQEALAAHRKAVECQPRSAMFHNHVGALLRERNDLDGAIAAYRQALDADPNHVPALSNLGKTLLDQGKLEEALTTLRRAVAADPEHAGAHARLGLALTKQGRLEEAVACYRKALQLKPDEDSAHNNLGVTLQALGDLDGALAAYRAAVQHYPDHALSHWNLGLMLRRHGELTEALAHLKKAVQLGVERPPWQINATQRVKETERLVELEKQLPAILSGQVMFTQATEWLECAQLCHFKKHYAAAARFYQKAFSLLPKVNDFQRFAAASSAARAGCGEGVDTVGSDRQERTEWRLSALAWLRAILDRQEKRLQTEPPEKQKSIRNALRGWQRDWNFACVRAPARLAQLPEMERAAWGQFWAKVDELVGPLDFSGEDDRVHEQLVVRVESASSRRPCRAGVEEYGG